LTYDNAHLPKDTSVDVREFQLFMKRLRKAYPKDRIRFFHCGEYGEKLARPHYHACLFNFDFPDKVPHGEYFTSKSLDRIWGNNDPEKCPSIIGRVTFESAAYVARYITKKITGDEAQAHYVDKKTGVVRRPEYVTMSRRPGIGRGWYDRFKGDLYPSDSAVVRGVEVRPAKFYDGVFERENPVVFAELKAKRLSRVKHLVSLVDRLAGKSDFVEDSTPDRLVVREEVHKSRAKNLVRKLEESQ